MNGKLQGVFAAARDISEYKKLERELHNEQNYTRSLIESSIDPLMTTDSLGNITDVNQQMEKITGYNREELIGTPFKNYVTDPARAEEGIRRVLEEKKVVNYELIVKARDGHTTIVSYNATVFFDVKGKLQGVFAAARDITEQKVTEEKLKEAVDNFARSNKELEQFAYIASHDLQQPLRMVESYTQLLARRYKGKLDQDADDFIQFVVSGVKRMQGLINNLLEYSRVTTRGKPLVPTDCNQVVKQILTDYQEKIKERDAIITVDVLPTINADEIQIGQLFQNLISNALKFCEQKPVIHIGVKEEKKQWVFSVSDNGIGISTEYFSQIFVIFQRLVSEEQYPGNGMGLAICKRIVERHGGKIWLTSEVGKGSVFYFSIPK
jgi:PAS domain S-box-containing protein